VPTRVPFSKRLEKRFFNRDAPALARALLGCILVHDSREGTTAGIIVETEAYDQSDPASHSASGPTLRNRVMFGPAGLLYVYFSYGVHWCANIVAGPEGHGAAVLLRALEPTVGLEVMALRRGQPFPSDPRLLASGPGRLTQAMGITRSHNGADLCNGGPLFVMRPSRSGRCSVTVTARVGISKAQRTPWRFFLTGSRFVSR
jgi:DNA-3-methyladenine glycosylase